MDAQTQPLAPLGLRLIRGFTARRLGFTIGMAIAIAVLLSPVFITPLRFLIGRTLLIGGVALAVFVLFENAPQRLPRWLQRWYLQLGGVVISVPVTTFTIYWFASGGNLESFLHSEGRIAGFLFTAAAGLVLGPLAVMTALFQQRDAEVRSQALAFELERSELQRRALDARLRLLHAQVEPHFLFNTLANVRALVDAGSPKASSVLSSLIAYLRAAVPRLEAETSTLGQELQLARAYLELMHLRMPDRLQFTFDPCPDCEAVPCPPVSVLTLVENAVRHGIDPSEEGGRIEVRVRLEGEGTRRRCHVTVEDTGVGLRQGGAPGVGLANLRERLQLTLGAAAQLHLTEVLPHGVRAELILPLELA
ncbi:sensor histidine kinase [Inhella gelatinilytica]|uniref:Histidine kinase n=1 Tax=Inhella gelatinilytica TaxID=2795030 RepID=A0A931J2T7_9BURK|nr:histidine kinase [Inhella gelatinilytica]MBH9554296.1 histidine kinase [Inhella gelatinilytica]